MMGDKTHISEETKKTLLRLFSTDQESILDKFRKDVEREIEREKHRYDFFLYQEKEYDKVEQCKGGIEAYKEILKLIDKYKRKEVEDLEEACWNILTHIKESEEQK